MYLTEKEIMSTHEALEKSFEQVLSQRSEIEAFFEANKQRKLVFIGCGSSLMLAKGCEKLFGARAGCSAVAIAGGDYVVAPDFYEEYLKDAIVVALSRSGETTEILKAISLMNDRFNIKLVSITMNDESKLAKQSDLGLFMPWAYDKSVCQTRSITNIYAASLLLYAIIFGNEELIADVKKAVSANEKFMADNRAALEKIGNIDFSNVVVLADGPLCGMADEGALAFTEIALVPGQFHNMLDYRHGPIVLNDKNTLTIAVLQTVDNDYQQDLVKDVKAHGGTVVTIGEGADAVPDIDLHIAVGEVGNFTVIGIYFIYVCQMIAFARAVKCGIDPDKPIGLNLFVTLK